MPRFRVPLVFPSYKNKMGSIKDIICKVAAYVKIKFHGTNLPTEELLQ